VFDNQRLAWFNIFIKFIIVCYGVLSALLNHKYALFEVPVSTLNLWSNDWNPDLDLVRHQQVITGPEYCGNSAYDVDPSESSSYFGASNITCKKASPLETLTIVPPRVMVSSFAKVRNLTNPTKSVESNYFYVGVEEHVVNFQHSASTSFGSFVNVRTRFRNSATGETVVEFPAKSLIKNLTIGDFLRFADVDLSANLFPEEMDTMPKIKKRVSGVLISVELRYSNLRQGDLTSEVICDAWVSQQPWLWGYSGTDVLHDAHGDGVGTVSTNAVTLVFFGRGSLGQFDSYLLLLNLISIIVLLKFSSQVVDFIGRKLSCLGDRTVFTQNTTHFVSSFVPTRNDTHTQPRSQQQTFSLSS